MTFKKPENIRYVDMCIYIDTHIYTDEYDVNLVYEYLYHIFYMLASKHSLFNKQKYYDLFALFAANRLYFRLTNPKQFETSNGEPKMKRITSILNYAKNTLYHLKVDFEQEEYCQNLVEVETSVTPPNHYCSIVQSFSDTTYRAEFEMTLHDIVKTSRLFLSTIPYKTNSVTWLNIYTSVMLNILNSVTFSNSSAEQVERLKNSNRLTDYKLNTIFERERNSDIILFHLPESMRNYIDVLTRRLRRLIGKDLSELLVTTHLIDATELVRSSLDEYKE